jgi:hypothetical protein
VEGRLNGGILVALGGALVLGACHKQLDPLAEQRVAVTTLQQQSAGLPANHVLFEVSKAQMDQLVSQIGQHEAEKNKRVFIPGPMGMPLEAVNDLQSTALTLSSGSCAGCLAVQLTVSGHSELGSSLSSLKAPLTWSLKVSGLLALGLEEHRVLLVPQADWWVDSVVEGLPAVLNEAAASTLKTKVANELVRAKMDAPIVVATLPDLGWVQLSSLDFRPGDALQVGVAMGLRHVTEVGDKAAPAQGVRLRISEGTLHGVLEGVLLSQKHIGGYAASVEALNLGEQAVITLRLIRANRRAASRLVRLDTHIELAETGKLVVDEIAFSPADPGWHTLGTRLVGRRGMTRWMKKAVERSLPTQWRREGAETVFSADWTGVSSEDGELILVGKITLETSDSSESQPEHSGDQTEG